MVAKESDLPVALVENSQLLLDVGGSGNYFLLVLLKLLLKSDGSVVGSEDLGAQIIHMSLEMVVQFSR